MRSHSSVVRRVAVLAAFLSLGALTACSDDEPEGEAKDPEQVLEEAKAILDETSGVDITLSTEDLPSGVTGIKAAKGVGTPQPAFEGEFDLSVNGLPATAEVIAVDGTTYAKNSLLLPDWTPINPDDYGAPDPATFMDPETGFSNLLAASTDVEEGDSVRGGADNEEVLTEYTGTIPSEAVAALIPTAEGDFDVVFTISEDGELRAADMTGVFYEGEDELTYELDLDNYGTEVEITAP